MVFCGKEAVYKAINPLTGDFLGFSDVELDIDPAAGEFRARCRRDLGSAVPGGRRTRLLGRVPRPLAGRLRHSPRRPPDREFQHHRLSHSPARDRRDHASRRLFRRASQFDDSSLSRFPRGSILRGASLGRLPRGAILSRLPCGALLRGSILGRLPRDSCLRGAILLPLARPGPLGVIQQVATFVRVVQP